MHNLVMVGAIAVSLCLGMDSLAQERDQEGAPLWRVSMGYTRRSLGDARIHGFEFTEGNDNYVNGSVQDLGNGYMQYNVEDSVRQVDNVNLNTVDMESVSTGDGGEDHPDAANGLTLSCGRQLWQSDSGRFTAGVEFSLLSAFFDDRADMTGTSTTYRFALDAGGNTWTNLNSPLPGGGPDPGTTSEVFKVYNVSQIFAASSPVVSAVVYDMDLDIATLGLGLTGRMRIEPVQVFVEAGPTATLVHVDVSRTATVRWADATAPFYRDVVADAGTRWRMGLYVSAGISYTINEYVDLVLSGRYDEVPSDLNTEVVSFDLSGCSTSFLLRVCF